jgi:MOSC domain-containing protein YiiM
MSGRIERLGVKPKTPGERGLPKAAVEAVVVTGLGLDGDWNRHRMARLAADPKKAVLLITLDALESLRHDGWPVRPGDLGENLTVSGVPYDAFAVGSRWAIGRAVEIEITEPCTPCRNLAVLPYVGQACVAEFITTTLGRRGWYGRVLAPGRVRVGDRVVPRETPAQAPHPPDTPVR